VATLASVVAEQRQLLEQHPAAASTPDVLFYSTRPAAQGEIRPLPGPPLAEGDLAQDEGSDGSPFLLEIDMIEAGKVRGWACKRGEQLPSSLQLELYVDGIRAATARTSDEVTLPREALERCGLTNEPQESVPLGFQAQLPPLPQGLHEVRVAHILLPT